MQGVENYLAFVIQSNSEMAAKGAKLVMSIKRIGGK